MISTRFGGLIFSASVLIAGFAVDAGTNSASASTVEITYSGDVGSGQGPNGAFSGADGLGLFGSAGNSLFGAPFTLTFKFDNTAGTLVTQPGRAQLQSGSVYSQPPNGIAQLTINGHTVNFASGAYYDLFTFENTSLAYNVVSADLVTQSGSITSQTTVFAELLNSDTAEPFPVDFSTPFSSNSNQGGYAWFNVVGASSTSGSYLNVTSVDVTLPSTPIPATLPLFVSGLGGILGLLGWRRKRKAPAIAA